MGYFELELHRHILGTSETYITYCEKGHNMSPLKEKTAHLIDAPSNFQVFFPSLYTSLSSPAGGAKTHTFVCQTPLNLRGRRLVSFNALSVVLS